MTYSNYETRLRRVNRHIWDHPAGDLSLDALADVAALSRFHFHRVYHALTGETAAQAVRRLRLHRAGFALTQTDAPIGQIAAQVGYDNVDSFARAFRAQYGQTPAVFRQTGVAELASFPLRTGDPDMYPTEIRDIAEMRLAAMPHTGAYHQIGRAFGELAAMFTARGYWPQAAHMVGVYYDSPADVPEDQLRSMAGVAVADGFAMPEDLTEVMVPGGSYLVVTVKGPYTGLPAAWDHLYGVILPGSGRLPGDSAPVEVYLNNAMDTAPEDLVTEIRVLLA